MTRIASGYEEQPTKSHHKDVLPDEARQLTLENSRASADKRQAGEMLCHNENDVEVVEVDSSKVDGDEDIPLHYDPFANSRGNDESDEEVEIAMQYAFDICGIIYFF